MRDADPCVPAPRPEERELDVAHAHARRIGEAASEEEAGGAERGRAPTPGSGGSRSARRARPPPPAGRSGSGRSGARGRSPRRRRARRRRTTRRRPPASSPNCEEAAGDEERGRQLDGRVEGEILTRRSGSGRAAEPREHRHVVVPRELVPAAHAGRGRPHDGAAQGHARSDDVHEAAERKRGPEREKTESDVHLRPIGVPRLGT